MGATVIGAPITLRTADPELVVGVESIASFLRISVAEVIDGQLAATP